MAEASPRFALPHGWARIRAERLGRLAGQGIGGFGQRTATGPNRPDRQKNTLPLKGGSGRNRTRTCDPIDVNDVLSLTGSFLKLPDGGTRTPDRLK